MSAPVSTSCATSARSWSAAASRSRARCTISPRNWRT
jgi:hypothetical protein